MPFILFGRVEGTRQVGQLHLFGQALLNEHHALFQGVAEVQVDHGVESLSCSTHRSYAPVTIRVLRLQVLGGPILFGGGRKRVLEVLLELFCLGGKLHVLIIETLDDGLVEYIEEALLRW